MIATFGDGEAEISFETVSPCVGVALVFFVMAAKKPSSSFTYQITADQGDILKQILEEQQFEFRDLDYGHFGAKRGKCSIGYYHSGKVVIQGKDAREFIEFYFEPMVTGEVRLGYEKQLNPEMFQPHFGIDEAGKGDFFGPLVIAGAYVDEELGDELMDMGVADSKKLTDGRVETLAKEIKKLLGNRWEVIAIGPAKYNQLYRKFANLNKLLAWGHAQVIENLLGKVPDCPRALSDKFAHSSLIERELKRREINIEMQQRTKGESDLAVAAASILARDGFIAKLSGLGEEYGVNLPKGAGSIVDKAAKQIYREHGVEMLPNVAKTHFRNYSKVVDAQ